MFKAFIQAFFTTLKLSSLSKTIHYVPKRTYVTHTNILLFKFYTPRTLLCTRNAFQETKALKQ